GCGPEQGHHREAEACWRGEGLDTGPGEDGGVVQVCRICLTNRKKNEEWLLLVENRWTDRLKILSWHEELAATPATHSACCPAHVQLLVIHWMTTGTLAGMLAGLKDALPKQVDRAEISEAEACGEYVLTEA